MIECYFCYGVGNAKKSLNVPNFCRLLLKMMIECRSRCIIQVNITFTKSSVQLFNQIIVFIEILDTVINAMLVNVISPTKLVWSYHRNSKLLFSAYFRGRAQIPLIRSSIPRVWGYKYSRKNDVFNIFDEQTPEQADFHFSAVEAQERQLAFCP